jgi:hypothetical protein
VANLLLDLDSYLQQLRQHVARSCIKPFTAATALQLLRTWMQKQDLWGIGCLGPVLEKLEAEEARFTPFLQEAAAAPVLEPEPSTQPFFGMPQPATTGTAAAAAMTTQAQAGGIMAPLVATYDGQAANSKVMAQCTAEEAMVAANAHLQDSTPAAQQGYQKAGQGLSSAGAAAVAAAQDATGAAAVFNAAAAGIGQPAALAQLPLHAAAAAVTRKLTVGVACDTCSCHSVKAALRGWAKICYPHASQQTREAVPVANLLPSIDSYLQHLQQRVAYHSLKPKTAAELLQRLQRWLRRHQQQLGVGCSHELLQQLTEAQRHFMQKASDSPAARPGTLAPACFGTASESRPATTTAAMMTVALAGGAGGVRAPLVSAPGGTAGAALPAHIASISGALQNSPQVAAQQRHQDADNTLTSEGAAAAAVSGAAPASAADVELHDNGQPHVAGSAAACPVMAQHASNTAAAATTARIQGARYVFKPVEATAPGVQTGIMQGLLLTHQQQQQLKAVRHQQQLLLQHQQQQLLALAAQSSKKQAQLTPEPCYGSDAAPTAANGSCRDDAAAASMPAVEAAPAAAPAAAAAASVAVGDHVIAATDADVTVVRGAGAARVGSEAQESPGLSGLDSQRAAAHALLPVATQPAMDSAGDLSGIIPMADWEDPAGMDDPEGDMLMPDLGVDLEYLAASPRWAVAAAADDPV